MSSKKAPETKREIHLSYLATQTLVLVVQSAISTIEAIAGETKTRMDHVERLRASMLFEQAGYKDIDQWAKNVRDTENRKNLLLGHINKSEDKERKAAFVEIESVSAALKVLEDKGPVKHKRQVDLALISWFQKQITKSDVVLSGDAIFVYGELCTAFKVELPAEEKDKAKE